MNDIRYNEKPTHKAIHPESFRDQVARKIPPHKPKLGKEYVFANANN